MTIFFPADSITIRRERNFGGGLKFKFSATYTAYPADIQPVEAERVNLFGGRIGKTYEAWIDSSVDVKEGDQIVNDGETYSVTAVSTFQGAGLLDHTSLILIKQD